MTKKYSTNLDKVHANHLAMSPNSLVRYAATAYPDEPAIEFDDRTKS